MAASAGLSLPFTASWMAASTLSKSGGITTRPRSRREGPAWCSAGRSTSRTRTGRRPSGHSTAPSTPNSRDTGRRPRPCRGRTPGRRRSAPATSCRTRRPARPNGRTRRTSLPVLLLVTANTDAVPAALVLLVGVPLGLDGLAGVLGREILPALLVAALQDEMVTLDPHCPSSCSRWARRVSEDSSSLIGHHLSAW